MTEDNMLDLALPTRFPGFDLIRHGGFKRGELMTICSSPYPHPVSHTWFTSDLMREVMPYTLEYPVDLKSPMFPVEYSMADVNRILKDIRSLCAFKANAPGLTPRFKFHPELEADIKKYAETEWAKRNLLYGKAYPAQDLH